MDLTPATGSHHTVAAAAVQVRVPFRRPFVSAADVWTHRESWIIRLINEDGRIGLGEAALDPAAGGGSVAILARLVRETIPAVAAGSVPSVADLEQLGAPGRALRAALDGAVAGLDLAGASAGAPTVAVNATVGFTAPAAAGEAALQALEAGFTTLKVKAGVERETEDLVARVAAVRGAVGPDVRLRLDVNGAWDLPTAIERLEAVARYRIEYVEQPLSRDDLDGHAELRRAIRIPVALDEAVESVAAARAILAAGAADVLVVKPARVGGPVATAEIGILAARAGVPVVVSTLFETGVGIAVAARAAAALRSLGADGELAHGLATTGLLEADLLAAHLRVEDGRMVVPGAELALDERALERYAIERIDA